ncbi:MAG: ImmA/IrrE family metallo-endopeptidase [Bacillota bacterium]|nr:ImmA/IrrE family metallo-endopeptidase [Bacillota bacterium]
MYQEGYTGASEPIENADALLLRMGSSAQILLNSNNRYLSRDSFSIAHELGHYCLPGHNQSQYYCNVREIFSFQSSNQKEREANRFAAELLMPTSWLKNIVKTSDVSLSLIKSIAEACQTSLTATAIKIIGICPDRVGIVCSEDGIIKWTAKAKSFPYELRTGRVDESSPVVDFFETGDLPEGSAQVPSFFWISSPGTHEFINEESVSMPYLNAVLTVLTLPFDEDDDDEWLDGDSW